MNSRLIIGQVNNSTRLSQDTQYLKNVYVSVWGRVVPETARKREEEEEEGDGSEGHGGGQTVKGHSSHWRNITWRVGYTPPLYNVIY